MSGKSLCKWCDTQVNGIIIERENGVVVWIGCSNCYIKRKGLKNAK